MVDKHERETVTKEDRGLPSIGEQPVRARGRWIQGLLFILAGVAIVWFFWPQSENGNEALLPAKTEDVFNRGNIAEIQIPEISDDPPPPLPLPELEDPVALPESPPLPAAVVVAQGPSPEEQARLKAEANLRERRKRSPLVIYDILRSRNPSAPQLNEKSRENELLEQQNEILERFSESGSDNTRDLDELEDRLTKTGVTKVIAGFLKDRPYVLAQGKMLGGILETAISSNLPGMVRALISESVYSEDGRNLLIEKGSRIIGEYRAGLTQGQARIFVIWNRIITPYGIDIQITSPGAGSLGRSGHGGWVDAHFLERFGASILLSLVDAAIRQTNADDQLNVDLGDDARSASEIALENSINIRPTLHKNQGDRIKIFVTRDLNFKPVFALRSQ